MEHLEIKGKIATAIAYAKVIEDEAVEQPRPGPPPAGGPPPGLRLMSGPPPGPWRCSYQEKFRNTYSRI